MSAIIHGERKTMIKSKIKELLATKVAQQRLLEWILQSKERNEHDKEDTGGKSNNAANLPSLIKQKNEKFSNTKRLVKWQGTIYTFQ